jgi:predicted RNA binding protein YcfA (HicA-like mRNA interferase family)
MPRLIAVGPREVIQKLRVLGFDGPYSGGRHMFMRHSLTQLKISIPLHKGQDIPIGTLRAIIRQLGLTVEEWLAL